MKQDQSQISFDDIKKTLKELADSQKKTDEQIAKTDVQLAKTDAQLAKTDAQLAKTDAQLEKTVKKLDKLGVMYGGLGNNLGAQAEEFFYQGLQKKMEISGIKFDEIDKNIYFRGKEYDIVLFNGNSVMLISVKHHFHPKDVDHFLKEDIPVFKTLFPQYESYKIYGGVASLARDKITEKIAKENGLFVLTQSGDQPMLLNEKGFEAKIFE